jgi:TRAP-type transport system small permease protein
VDIPTAEFALELQLVNLAVGLAQGGAAAEEDMIKFRNLWERLSRMLALVGFFGLFVLASMTTLDILMRWLFSAPLQGVNDISAVVMAIVISSCVPANLAFKQNIRVEMLGAAAGPMVEGVLEAFASLLTLVFIVLISWQFIPYTWGLKSAGNTTWVLNWPLWPWWLTATAMLIFATVVQAVVFIDDLVSAFRGATRHAHP